MSNSKPNSKDILDRTYENSKAIAVVRTELKDLKEDVKHIKDNDLHEINKKIDRMNWWLVLLMGGLAANLVILLIERV